MLKNYLNMYQTDLKSMHQVHQNSGMTSIYQRECSRPTLIRNGMLRHEITILLQSQWNGLQV